MIRRVAALLSVMVALVVLGACSSVDSPTKVSEGAVDTGDSSTTSEDEATTTTEDEGLQPKIDLGGLGSSTPGGITSDQEECLGQGVLDDPVLSTYEGFAELQAGPQEDRERFFVLFIDCVGADTAIDQFMDGFAQGGQFDDEQLACARTEVEALSTEQLAAVLAADLDIATSLTEDIATNCLIGGP